MQFMRKMPADLQQKCEGLLHFEYILLKERAKNIIVKENFEKEITHLQSEKEEVLKDREKYS